MIVFILAILAIIVLAVVLSCLDCSLDVKTEENKTKIQTAPPQPLTNEEIMWFKEKFPSSATEAIHYFTTIMADRKERFLVKIAEDLSITVPRASALCGALTKKGYLCRGEVKVRGKGTMATYRVQ
jgi:hypothetical protein